MTMQQADYQKLFSQQRDLAFQIAEKKLGHTLNETERLVVAELLLEATQTLCAELLAIQQIPELAARRSILQKLQKRADE